MNKNAARNTTEHYVQRYLELQPDTLRPRGDEGPQRSRRKMGPVGQEIHPTCEVMIDRDNCTIFYERGEWGLPTCSTRRNGTLGRTENEFL